MSFQPPPQQPPGGPPPPPPGQWGPPPGGGYPQGGGGAQFDPKAVNPLDWGILAAGLLAFIFSFFDWYTASVSVGGFSSSAGESAWNGFFGWFAVLLAVVGAALIAVAVFAPQVSLPVPVRLASVILFAVATLSVILALFIFPESVPDNSNIDTGRGFGFWAGAIVIIAGLVLSVMRLQQTGGQLPGALGKVPNIGRHGPQGGIAGTGGAPQGYAPPQQQGYGQPPAQAPQQGQYAPPQPSYSPPPQQPPQAPPPPPQAGQYQPPPQQPPQGGQYQPPPQQPPQGAQYQPPPQQPPQGGQYQPPPQQPPQGGQYRPPQQ